MSSVLENKENKENKEKENKTLDQRIKELEEVIETLTSRRRAYKIQFRHKNRYTIPSGKVQEKVFWFAGNLKEATIEARKHCNVMDYAYICCFPYIVDLKAQEELKGRDVDGEFQDEY